MDSLFKISFPLMKYWTESIGFLFFSTTDTFRDLLTWMVLGEFNCNLYLLPQEVKKKITEIVKTEIILFIIKIFVQNNEINVWDLKILFKFALSKSAGAESSFKEAKV